MYSTTPRILCVEDHQDTLELFSMVLSQQNYEVVTASSVERASEAAKAQHFDILVLDSWLSDGSGIDLCKHFRETDLLPRRTVTNWLGGFHDCAVC